jgi:chitodextrinase
MLPLSVAGAVPTATLTGRAVTDVADGFRQHRSTRTTFLETAGKRYRLTGALAASVQPGQMLRVVGSDGGSAFDVHQMTSMRAPETLDGSGPAGPIVKRVAVLLVNFRLPNGASLPIEPWTRSQIDELYFSGTRSVADYYDEISNGAISVSGDVFGYITLARSTSRCEYSDWGLAARKAAKNAGIDLTPYTNVVYVFPRQQSCWWSGMSTTPGRNSWINGEMTMYVGAHELGHNFGLDHASSLICRSNGVPVAVGGKCSLDEYGDPFDVMGFMGQPHFNNWHSMQLGVLGPEEMQTVTASGTYRFGPAELVGDLPRLLRIARPGGDFYYLESRQPFGKYDDFSPDSSVVNGVSIRIAPNLAIARSKLIDTTPQTSSFADSALAVGRTFSDTANGIFVKLLQLDATGATVSIQVGADTSPPSAPADLNASVDDSGTVRLTWTDSTDDMVVTGYDVTRDGTWLAKVDAPNFVDAGLEQDRSYEYTVTARDRSNSSEPVTVSVYVPPATAEPPAPEAGDTTPPSAPSDLTGFVTMPRVATLTWSAATDDVGVHHYRVLRNGSLLATTRQLEMREVRVTEGATYHFEIRAVDAAGNVGDPVAFDFAVPDVTPPGQLFGLNATVLGENSARLKWQAARDNVGVAGYVVLRDGVQITTLTRAIRSFTDTSMSAGVAYRFAVAAVDLAGNVGSAGRITVTPHFIDRMPPTAPFDLQTLSLGRRKVSVSWQPSTDDQPGTVRYRVFRGRKLIATVTKTTLVDRPARTGSYRYRVRAVDAAGNVSTATAWTSGDALRRVPT